MLEFITTNYVILLVVLIIIFCLVIFLAANGKLFKSKKTTEEKKDIVNNEVHGISSTANTNGITNPVTAATTTAADAIVNNNEINKPLENQKPVTEENAPLPEDIFTPIEEVPALNSAANDTLVAEPNETLVEPTVIENNSAKENINAEVASVNENTIVVDEAKETVVPVEPLHEDVSYETNKDILVNVLDTPVNETIAETPVTEEITFDFMPFEENNDTKEAVSSVNEVMEAPIIDEQPSVSAQEAPIEEEKINQQEEIIDEDPTLFVDESTFFNAHLYDEDPNEESASSEISVVNEPVDKSFDEIEIITDDIIDMPNVNENSSLEEVAKEETNSTITVNEPIEANTEESLVIENVDVEENTVDQVPTPSKETIETLSSNTSQEVDTAENVSETNEDEEWKF